MALKISYGNGTLGDVENPDSTVNSYARVTAVTNSTVTFNNTTKITGAATFDVGAKILIHVSATAASTDIKYLGNWKLLNVTAVNSNVLTVDADPTDCIPAAELGKYYVQIVAVAQYKNLKLETGSVITPPIYSASSYVGGIVALMCSETLTFAGGNIVLADRGIPAASKALRPTTANDVAKDTDNYSGWENSDTRIHMFLNAGDGATFIAAKKLVCDENSRIGNPSTYGVQFFRGNSTSVTYNETKPSGVTNVGGSTIFIAAETIENFSCKMIAKYRNSASTAGQGICRCYIASETKLRNDEGLYAYDCISDPKRLKRQCNVKNFGNGSFGDGANITTQLNNYATITAINGRKISYTAQTTAGLAQIGAGALVMIHFNHKGNTNVVDAGRFILANVLADNGTTLTVDADIPNISVTDYAAQVISIPQFDNFTLSTENKATPKFNGSQGGLCAIAVKNNCNLSGGKIYVEAASTGYAYAREGLGVIGNAQDSDKLPIGAGCGSVFILAQSLTMNENTNLGKAIGSANRGAQKHGYAGIGYGGSGAAGAAGAGYGSNSTTKGNRSKQGAHVMIVADTITGLNQKSLSTGGGYGIDGGAGYGSIGGYNGGGRNADAKDHGGSSGWCFIYCNNAVNQDTSGTILAN